MAEHPMTKAFSTDVWRDEAGSSWVAHADKLEATLSPISGPLFAHAKLAAGERVLDVGCGRGATTLAAAQIVGPDGAVVGVDVSADSMAAAKDMQTQESLSVEWSVGDAQRADLGSNTYDAVISRFGVMFFDDPVEAFANLKKATRPGGRLAVATWPPDGSCDFQRVGKEAIFSRLQAEGYEVPPSNPTAGPWSFGVEDYIRSVLLQAGWEAISINHIEHDLYFGGAGASAEEAVAVAMGMRGFQKMLESIGGDHVTELAAEALLEAYSACHDGTGVLLNASVVLTTAKA